MMFEIGKTYQHTTGEKLNILGRLETWMYGQTLIAENDSGELKPVGEHECAAVNWSEIPHWSPEPPSSLKQDDIAAKE